LNHPETLGRFDYVTRTASMPLPAQQANKSGTMAERR